MGAVYFYHLTREPVEATLPILLGKAQGAGWRIAVRGTDPARMAWLDEQLWTNGADDSFLAHGLAGGEHDADQPILLSCDVTNANTPACVMCIDSAKIDAAEVEAMERVCILFDGNNPDALQAARDQWKILTGAGCSAQYWSQESGRWEKKAEK